MTELTDRERAILDFEAGWWQQRGAKEDAITEQFAPNGTGAAGY